MFFTNGTLESRLARLVIVPVRTATKRASGGKSANNNTAGRRLGPKKSENEYVSPGQIIWRQRGTKWYPGENTGIGRDHTIFAKEPGFVRYYRDPFHAKRRFIGIALDREDRLPTPHFEPTKRRFGYTPIDNEEVAQFEMEYLGRKDTHRLAAREAILAKRAESKARRQSAYASVLKATGVSLTGAEEVQLSRLDLIYQFMCGGMTCDEARKTVDSQIREDYDLDLHTKRITEEEHAAKITQLEKDAAAVDNGVTFSAFSRELVPLADYTASSYSTVSEKIAALTSKYLESEQGTPSEVVNEVLAVLKNSPALSRSEVAHLKAKYLRRPKPVLITSENDKSCSERAKKGDGEISNVWSDEGLKRYFVPKGSKLLFQ